MSVLCVPTGSNGVKAYRFRNPRLGQTIHDGALDSSLVRWLERNGTDWDGFWTNGYSEEAHAIADMFQEIGVPVVVDVDDHFDELPKGNVAHRSWYFKKKKLYNAMLDEADRRVASTPFLADRHGCEVAPNFVHLDEWEWPERDSDDGSCVILHAGSVNRAEDYLRREESFKRVLDLPHTKIVFVGWMPKWAKDYPAGKVVFCRWVEYEKYPRMLRWINPDITVSPLEHNDFNLAKSNIKWLEAGCMGACFVGERWGEYARTVEDGVTGVLAEGEEEWTEALVGLAQDAALRTRIAAAGRAEVYSGWTWPAVEKQWRRAVLGEE